MTMQENEQTVLWQPSRDGSSNLEKFMDEIAQKYGLSFPDYQSFHRWSVEHTETFWTELLRLSPMIYSGNLRPAVLDKGFTADLVYNWFPGVKLNFAQNLLRARSKEAPVLSFIHETELQHTLNFGELTEVVSKLQQALRPFINSGEVLGAYMPNIPETVISMLAATSLGGVFTSTSCDFGVEGVLDRFSQSRPKVLVVAAGYTYNGKYICQREKILALSQRLDSVEKILVVDFVGRGFDFSDLPKAQLFSDFLKPFRTQEVEYTQTPFDHPVYIMYSSGTTGKPKCIVHGVGGVLLQHYKELKLHTDLKPREKLFYFTTCGWMMWNWLVSGLLVESEIVLYEGSPAFPSLKDFLTKLDGLSIEVLGTSPKFLKALSDDQTSIPSFKSLKTILSTGSPLLAEQFDYVYQNFPSKVQLASISGGTDILGCFMLGNPLTPVVRGEIQGPGLGMDVSSFDTQGLEILDREGELVCRKNFPSRPLRFLNDEGNEKFKEAYFQSYPGVWTHGDFITLTSRGSVRVYGRSDATLNPGGVRIGTAEIYAQTETLSFIEDSLCVGRPFEGDVQVMLFVKLKKGHHLTNELIKQIKLTIREKTTPRHVPSHILSVRDIPYTRSGKKMELAITRLLSGKELTNLEAIANPESLEDYQQHIKDL